MRIAFLSAAAYLSDHLPTGEGLIAHNLLCELSRRGHRVVAFVDTADMRRPPPYEVVALAPPGRRVNSLWPVSRALRLERALRKAGGGASFDAVHWLMPANPLGMSLGSASRAARVVIGPIGLSWPQGSDRPRTAGDAIAVLLRPLLRRRYGHIADRADDILVSLPAVRDDVPESLRNKVSVTGFSVDIAPYEVGPAPDVPIVLFVGRLTRAKGVRDLLEAFAIYAASASGRLVLAGEGEEGEWLRRRARELGVDRRVELLGRIPHGDVPALLRTASVFCVPSVGEPFGMAFLEAMASGLPIIAVDSGGPAHLVRDPDGGRKVPAHDPIALARAIGDVLADPDERAAMGRRNRTMIEGSYSLDQWAARLENLYAGRGW